jgi:DNA polymerase elongation subunit (family B)
VRYNILKTKQDRNKPEFDDKNVVDFLNGSYEKDIFGKEMLGIRAIEVSRNHNNVDIFFAKDFQGDTPRFTHKNGLKPFVWSKKPTTATFFTHNIVELDETAVSNEIAILPNNRQITFDGIDNRILEERYKEDVKKYIVRYKIESYDEWKDLVNKKQRIYGINVEEQITKFESSTVKRMAEGFKYKFTLDDQSEKPELSDNPYFQIDAYGKPKKIKGSFKNLLDFFKEGGLSPKGTVYIDEVKLKNWFNSIIDEDDRIELFFKLHKWHKEFDVFTKDSVDWTKIIKWYQKKNSNISFKINRTYINKEIDTSIDKFLDFIKENDDHQNWFNIQLDEKKIIGSIIECQTYDNTDEQKDLLKWLNVNRIDVFKKMESQLFFVNPNEQYMIQTGRRLYKGIENYDDLHILTFDIETQAQVGNEHIKIAALKPELGCVFQIGIKDNRGFEKVLNADNPTEEQFIIEETYRIIGELDPDLLLTYNGEGFDFPFIEKRLELLGCFVKNKDGVKDSTKTTLDYIRDLLSPYYEKCGEVYPYFMYGKNEGAKVKVGGATEDYTQTKMYGRNICDVMFAVKRAAAQDKTIPNFKLKDNIIHANLAKKGRVYVKGDLIGYINKDKRPYYYNRESGEFFVSKKSLDFSKMSFDKSLIRENGDNIKFYKNKNLLFLYHENADGTKPIIADCENSFEIKNNFEDDKRYNFAKQEIDDNFLAFYQLAIKYDGIVSPYTGFTSDLKAKCPKICEYLQTKLKEIRVNFDDIRLIHQLLVREGFEKVDGSEIAKDHKDKDFSKEIIKEWNKYETVTGNYIIERYLIDDIEEPYLLDKLYSQATFEICKWLPTSYEKIATMGGATVWKLLLSTWTYLNCIAIPNYEEPRDFTGGLLGMVSAGFHQNIVKIDYSSLYPSEFLQHCEIPDIDITGIYKMLVKFGLYTRLDYKNKKNVAKKNKDYANEQYYDKKQLPLKILINSFYGMLGAPNVSPFCHIDSAWHITCSGRQHMRHLIHYFKPRGFKIIYFHTDGANFVIPKNADDYKYIGKGDNWLVTKDKEYTGVEAYVAEYNDIFMRGKMGVDIDEYAVSCINFSKGNFVYLKESKGDYKISYVGGTLTSKRQSEYIQRFFDKNLKTILLGDAIGFTNAYYEYLKKIHNQEIVAKEIASKARLTKELKDYIQNMKEGKGVRQAHMELAIQADLNVGKGDWIYYINIGDGKKETADKKTDRNVIGYFSLSSKIKCDSFIKDLKKLVKNPVKLENLILEYKGYGDEYQVMLTDGEESDAADYFEEYGSFTFNDVKVENTDPFATKRYSIVSKENQLDLIGKAEDIKFKYTFKSYKTKDDAHIVEVLLCNQRLTSRLVLPEELDAKVPYNPAKYVEKFNKALAPIWIVFHPEIRKKIPSPNTKRKTGEAKDRQADERIWFTKQQLEMVSDFPLDGKEEQQIDLDEVMMVTDDEMELWSIKGLSPNNSIDYERIDYNGTYWVNEKNEISKDIRLNSIEMTGSQLADFLKDKIIIDYDNPPYKFLTNEKTSFCEQ